MPLPPLLLRKNRCWRELMRRYQKKKTMIMHIIIIIISFNPHLSSCQK
jgi:hypothetical protein